MKERTEITSEGQVGRNRRRQGEGRVERKWKGDDEIIVCVSQDGREEGGQK